MAQKITLDFDVEEIKALVAQAAGQSPRFSRAVPGVVGRYARAVEQQQRFEQQPVPGYGGDLMAHGLALQQRQAEDALRAQIARAKMAPFQRAMGAVQFGAAIGGHQGIGAAAASFGQITTLLAAANPLTIAIVGATVAIAGLSVAAVEAGKMLRTLAQGALATGSTAGGFAFARALGGAAGLSPEGTGGFLQSLRQRIATEPLAMAAAGQFGVRALPPGFGPVPDMGRIFQTLFEGMRRMPRAQAQTFAEQVPEMQPFLAVSQFGSDAQIERIKRLAESMDALATPEAVRRSIDLSLAQQELSLEWQKLVTEVGSMVLPFVTSLVEALEQVVNSFGHAAKALGDFRQGRFSEGFKELFNPDATQKEGKGGRERHSDALKEHGDAMRDHSAELRLTRNGVFGGAGRAQSAIPPGLRGAALEQALQQHAVRLGAF